MCADETNFDSPFPKGWKLQKTLYTPEHDQFLKMLKAARKRAKLTQVQAAAALGVGQDFISNVERGVRRLDVIEFCYLMRLYRTKPQAFLKRLGLHK